MASIQKNVASQNITFAIVTTAGAAGTGKTVSVFVTKDNGAQASGGGTVTEAGNGQYNYAPTQAETNATDVGFLFTASGCVPENLDFHTDATDANGLLKVDVEDIGGSSTSGSNLSKATGNIGRGTCSTGSSLLAVTTSSFNIGGAGVVLGQFVGRTIIFDATTTTTSLQGEATSIVGNTAGANPTFTVTALTTAPVSGDTFSVI